MNNDDYKAFREQDIQKIKDSKFPRKVVVAGPGTGKSFLFKELIKAKQEDGKNNFIAITFVGKLGDALADDLSGLAKTMTMHGFAKDFIKRNLPKFQYYPNIYEIIKEDLEGEEIIDFCVGDENYRRKSNYYKAVGNADVIYYTVNMCRKDDTKIPKHDLVLVDEFQDFNETEAELIDVLSSKNEVVIVGDDDQSLYGFKKASPDFIREKYDSNNKDFESHTLRFCSRCTEVIIRYFHAIVEKYNLNEERRGRVPKDYICYLPDKKKDSDANQKIHLIKQCPPGMIASKVKIELEKILATQKIKEVLIIGEAQSCKTTLKDISVYLRNYGFNNVKHKSDENILEIKQEIVDAYKFINKDPKSLLGWRILGNPTERAEIDKHVKNAKTLKNIIKGAPSIIKSITSKKIEALEKCIEKNYLKDEIIRKNILVREIKKNNINLSRPLRNLEITVCNILNAKGLGADVVFVIGFDYKRFPVSNTPKDSEIYQMLVALTRARKRVYFINSLGKEVSSFVDCLNSEDLNAENV